MPTDPEERIRRLIAKILAIGAIAIALTFISHGFYHLHSGYMDDPRWKFRVWEGGGGGRSQAGRVLIPFAISIIFFLAIFVFFMKASSSKSSSK